LLNKKTVEKSTQAIGKKGGKEIKEQKKWMMGLFDCEGEGDRKEKRNDN
jgi:hypothetical protein